MCGIVAYVGKNQVIPILLDGLKSLEYRGYDSAGLAVYDSGSVVSFKEAGRVSQLEKEIRDKEKYKGVGIAHTRWATHGQPSQANAHPHGDCQDRIAIVHNGIIENYRDLKAQLVKEGHKFKSETDTEVLAHLIEKYFYGEKGRADNPVSLEEAARKALTMVEGTYGIAVICRDDPDKVVAARHGSPLCIGLGEGEYIVASDVSAIVRHTRQVIYMEDGEIAVLTPGDFKIITQDNQRVSKDSQKIEWDVEKVQKRGFAHFMLKEIFEQPETVENATRGRIIMADGLAKLGGLESVEEKLRKIERLVIVSCGTSYYAGLTGEYMLEEYAGIPVEVDFASEYRYRKPVLNDKTAVLAISQSGETADTLAALREAKRKGILTLGIVNVVGSTIARETDAGVYNHAGPEIGVASTKAFVSQITVMALLTMFLGRQRQMSMITGKRIGESLEKIPAQIRKILKQNDQIKKIAKKYAKYDDFLYLGRKYNFPVAMEGALKLKEISYVHAEGYGAGEMKHGPLALIDKDFPSVFIVPSDSVYEKVTSNMEEVKARGGKIIAIATEKDSKVNKLADDVIYIPKTLEMLTPLLSVVPLQLLAYHIAVLRGRDVDKPRNLAKSVTVE